MDEIKFLDGEMEMEYTRSPGKIIGRFLSGLRDQAEIQGIRCSKCSQVFVPPQQYCPDCGIKMENWVIMPEEGVVEQHTIVHVKTPFSDIEPPYAYVAVRFEGASTLFWHRMKNPEGVQNGLRVKPRFLEEEKRVGSIMDIDEFIPVQ